MLRLGLAGPGEESLQTVAGVSPCPDTTRLTTPLCTLSCLNKTTNNFTNTTQTTDLSNNFCPSGTFGFPRHLKTSINISN